MMFTDWAMCPEIKDIMEKFCKKFPYIFGDFDVDGFNVILTKGKKAKFPCKLHSVKYPFHAFSNGRPYIFEVFDSSWSSMDKRQKNTAVFHIMCGIPDGAFDEQSKMYGRTIKPSINMHLLEFAATGGVPNWFENSYAKDPMENGAEEVENNFSSLLCASSNDGDEISGNDEVKRVPVTSEMIGSYDLDV